MPKVMLGIAAIVVVVVFAVVIFGRSSSVAPRGASDTSQARPVSPHDRAALGDAAVPATPASPDAAVPVRSALPRDPRKPNVNRNKTKDDLEDLPPTYRVPAP